MKIFAAMKYLKLYSKGVVRFRSNDFESAQSFFEKAAQCKDYYKNHLFYQYYGQTLLALNFVDESFIWLSKAYEILDKEGWEASNEESYKLMNDTLRALQYLKDQYNLAIDGFENEKGITLKEK